uniref:Mitochondrial protein n=1 Tax=Vitis vinifera TaxID=29760 RepID=A5AYJ5_VITVI|nr:hypothetical protein VITISV_013262 [Vitis vinifera]
MSNNGPPRNYCGAPEVNLKTCAKGTKWRVYRSTFGYCTFLGGNLVTWRSKKHNVVARSSVEAEFRAMTPEESPRILVHVMDDNNGLVSSGTSRRETPGSIGSFLSTPKTTVCSEEFVRVEKAPRPRQSRRPFHPFSQLPQRCCPLEMTLRSSIIGKNPLDPTRTEQRLLSLESTPFWELKKSLKEAPPSSTDSTWARSTTFATWASSPTPWQPKGCGPKAQPVNRNYLKHRSAESCACSIEFWMPAQTTS